METATDKPRVELRRLVGQFAEPTTGKIRRAGWDMDQVFLDGRQIAMVNHVKGAPVSLFAGVVLSKKDEKLVSEAIASKREGVPPKSIGGPRAELLAFELLDDEEDEGDDE